MAMLNIECYQDMQAINSNAERAWEDLQANSIKFWSKMHTSTLETVNVASEGEQ